MVSPHYPSCGRFHSWMSLSSHSESMRYYAKLRQMFLISLFRKLLDTSLQSLLLSPDYSLSLLADWMTDFQPKPRQLFSSWLSLLPSAQQFLGSKLLDLSQHLIIHSSSLLFFPAPYFHVASPSCWSSLPCSRGKKIPTLNHFFPFLPPKVVVTALMNQTTCLMTGTFLFLYSLSPTFASWSPLCLVVAPILALAALSQAHFLRGPGSCL